ncbi:hypothetical protein BCD96_005028 [Clostridium beijerinckii]|nr:hypothetical protein [Clostridium beijerinckii]NOW07473.1 hypothetical protein [Clostridium beijerinckii]NRT37648.1 hypothetical protein [Clostridium beijerinckii]NRT48608.1 hypothetical protein [Clostridium beijerinckii]NRU36585.1 hypothetical protein [Clostridium beijerinckii]
MKMNKDNKYRVIKDASFGINYESKRICKTG